jgi:hypothetical protein
MGQSMLSAANSLANILGPIISGLVLPKVDVEFAMLLGTWVLIVLLLLLRWNALYTDEFGQMKRVDQVSKILFFLKKKNFFVKRLFGCWAGKGFRFVLSVFSAKQTGGQAAIAH